MACNKASQIWEIQMILVAQDWSSRWTHVTVYILEENGIYSQSKRNRAMSKALPFKHTFLTYQ